MTTPLGDLFDQARRVADTLDSLAAQKQFWRLVIDSAMAEWTQLDRRERATRTDLADRMSLIREGERAERRAPRR